METCVYANPGIPKTFSTVEKKNLHLTEYRMKVAHEDLLGVLLMLVMAYPLMDALKGLSGNTWPA